VSAAIYKSGINKVSHSNISGQYLFEVDIITQLHVLRMDAKDLETTSWVRDANVNFAIEATEATKSWIDGIRSVGSCHDHDI